MYKPNQLSATVHQHATLDTNKGDGHSGQQNKNVHKIQKTAVAVDAKITSQAQQDDANRIWQPLKNGSIANNYDKRHAG